MTTLLLEGIFIFIALSTPGQAEVDIATCPVSDDAKCLRFFNAGISNGYGSLYLNPKANAEHNPPLYFAHTRKNGQTQHMPYLLTHIEHKFTFTPQASVSKRMNVKSALGMKHKYSSKTLTLSELHEMIHAKEIFYKDLNGELALILPTNHVTLVGPVYSIPEDPNDNSLQMGPVIRENFVYEPSLVMPLVGASMIFDAKRSRSDPWSVVKLISWSVDAPLNEAPCFTETQFKFKWPYDSDELTTIRMSELATLMQQSFIQIGEVGSLLRRRPAAQVRFTHSDGYPYLPLFHSPVSSDPPETIVIGPLRRADGSKGKLFEAIHKDIQVSIQMGDPWASTYTQDGALVESNHQEIGTWKLFHFQKVKQVSGEDGRRRHVLVFTQANDEQMLQWEWPPEEFVTLCHRGRFAMGWEWMLKQQHRVYANSKDLVLFWDQTAVHKPSKTTHIVALHYKPNEAKMEDDNLYGTDEIQDDWYVNELYEDIVDLFPRLVQYVESRK